MKTLIGIQKYSEEKKFETKLNKINEDFEKFKKSSFDYIRENLK
jgi:hypothetical protein